MLINPEIPFLGYIVKQNACVHAPKYMCEDEAGLSNIARLANSKFIKFFKRTGLLFLSTPNSENLRKSWEVVPDPRTLMKHDNYISKYDCGWHECP